MKIDGTAIAKALRSEIAAEIKRRKALDPVFKPCLCVVQVGNRPDSAVYLRMKQKAALEAGILFRHVQLESTVSMDHLKNTVVDLNHDSSVHGIVVQLPLPQHLDESLATAFVDPEKDVDGFHPINVGELCRRNGRPRFVPCTPAGVLHLLHSTRVVLDGANVVVIGRSNVVGMPMAMLLIKQNATVTVAHRATRNLEALVRAADIVVSAAGCPGLIKADWIHPDCIVIDVGITCVEGTTRIQGDVEPNAKAKAITPVPGGVGPMTVCMLLQNTLKAANKN